MESRDALAHLCTFWIFWLKLFSLKVKVVQTSMVLCMLETLRKSSCSCQTVMVFIGAELQQTFLVGVALNNFSMKVCLPFILLTAMLCNLFTIQILVNCIHLFFIILPFLFHNPPVLTSIPLFLPPSSLFTSISVGCELLFSAWVFLP